jgi:hypothetical protein
MTTISRSADRQPTATALSGITSKLQKILLVEVLVFLGNSAAAVALIIATYGMATEDHFTGSTLVSSYLADGIPAALFAAAAVLTACVAVRTWKMLDAAGRGDVAALTRLSSPGWAVAAAPHARPSVRWTRARLTCHHDDVLSITLIDIRLD